MVPAFGGAPPGAHAIGRTLTQGAVPLVASVINCAIGGTSVVRFISLAGLSQVGLLPSLQLFEARRIVPLAGILL